LCSIGAASVNPASMSSGHDLVSLAGATVAVFVSECLRDDLSNPRGHRVGVVLKALRLLRRQRQILEKPTTFGNCGSILRCQ
jgi:hypothetical protein